MTVGRLNRLHHISGTVLAGFLILHISNHLFALGGPAVHIQVMKLLRVIYRFPPIEGLLLLCTLVQVASGVQLLRRKKSFWQAGYDLAQIISGLYLSFFLIFHGLAVCSGRWLYKVETDFYFAARVANQYPEKLFFIPYYTLALVSTFVHIACAHRMIMRTRQFEGAIEKESTVLRQTVWILGGGAVITTLIMLSLTGVLYVIS